MPALDFAGMVLLLIGGFILLMVVVVTICVLLTALTTNKVMRTVLEIAKVLEVDRMQAREMRHKVGEIYDKQHNLNVELSRCATSHQSNLPPIRY